MQRAWWSVAGDPYGFRYPETCACCGVETKDRWDQVPYCNACRKHVPRFGPWMLALGAIVVGGAVAIGMRRFAAFEGRLAHATVTVLAAMLVPVIALVLGRRRRVGAPHVDHEQAVEITREGLLVRSETWAAEVAKLNGREATQTIESSFALLERVLPFLGAAVPIAFGLWWFPHWHVTLWIDNGTPSRVVVHGDGHELASVPADGRRELSIPRGAVRLTSSAGDDATIDARVTTGVWVLDVAAAHCYEWQQFGYAERENTLYFGAQPKRYREPLFNVEATWFFEPPPKTITVEKSRAMPGLPERRAALQIVPCR